MKRFIGLLVAVVALLAVSAVAAFSAGISDED